jgi:hypothetical protein
MKSIDKSKWPEGEWSTESDRENYKTEEGFDAAIIRHPGLGHLCGYVGISQEHPLHGKSYDAAYGAIDPDVHGGLTYDGEGRVDSGEDPALWYFGFDCAHSGDLSPGMLRYGDCSHSAYRNIAYVKQHIARLSKSLAAAGVT